jgi:hypothetical protein
MTLVALASGRSPGVTTAAQALALAWPAGRQSILAELDPGGGSLSVRHELPADPGLTTLAAAGRRGLAPETVLQHCQRLGDGTVALLGPLSPERATSALAVLGVRFAAALDTIPDIDVLADCGRLDSRSPALDVVRAAPFVVLVVSPTLEGVAHLQSRLPPLALTPGRVAVLTIGGRPYGPDEVGAALQLPVLGMLEVDRRGAEDLASGRPLRRSELLRSAYVVAERLAARLPPVSSAAGAVAPQQRDAAGAGAGASHALPAHGLDGNGRYAPGPEADTGFSPIASATAPGASIPGASRGSHNGAGPSDSGGAVSWP